MSIEHIRRVEVLATGELLVAIDGEGKSHYQHIYREAAGVYWDPVLSGFRSTPIIDWSAEQWFEQIRSVAAAIGVNLRLTDDVAWVNIPEEQRECIRRASAN